MTLLNEFRISSLLCDQKRRKLAQGSQKYGMSFCFDFADANCLLFSALLRLGCLLFINEQQAAVDDENDVIFHG